MGLLLNLSAICSKFGDIEPALLWLLLWLLNTAPSYCVKLKVLLASSK